MVPAATMKTKHTLTVNNKKYAYTLKKAGRDATHVACAEASIDQKFLNEDIPALLIDLPKLILAEKKYKRDHDALIRFRVSTHDKKVIEKKAVDKGYDSVSEYLRKTALAG